MTRRLLMVLFFGGFAGAPGQVGATPPLKLPWPCGIEYTVTQGHNTGSHVGTYNAWAWDFGIPVGGEVAAPAAGVVRAIRMTSETGGCSSAFVNDANFVTIDHGDGTEAAFTHLLAGSSNLQVGDRVEQGQVVGQIGLSGWVCGAHLHFNIQNKCNGSAVCETIPAEFVSFGDPTLDTRLISDNCGACDAVLDGTTTVVDDMSGCFERRTTYWWQVEEGYEDHHFYTIAADAAVADTTGRWVFDVAVAGTYAVEVFIPATDATSNSASYIVATADGDVTAGPVDQVAQKEWVSLGEFVFAASQQGSVLLGDNTGEPIADEKRLAYDAIRLTYIPPPPEPDPADDMGIPDAGSSSTPDASLASDAANSPLPADGGEKALADAGRLPSLVDAEGACGCGTRRSSDATGWALVLGFLLFKRRERRAKSAKGKTNNVDRAQCGKN